MGRARPAWTPSWRQETHPCTHAAEKAQVCTQGEDRGVKAHLRGHDDRVQTGVRFANSAASQEPRRFQFERVCLNECWSERCGNLGDGASKPCHFVWWCPRWQTMECTVEKAPRPCSLQAQCLRRGATCETIRLLRRFFSPSNSVVAVGLNLRTRTGFWRSWASYVPCVG
jgi:hypothetical protein